MVKLVAIVAPVVGLRYARDVRESPTLAMTHLLSRITAHVKVVPEKSVSMDVSLYKEDGFHLVIWFGVFC